MRNNQLSFMQELVGDSHSFVEQSARILTKVKNQALKIALLIKLVERVLDFFFCRLIKSGNVHVADPRTDQKVQINAVTWDLVTDNGKFQRFIRTFPQDRDVNRRALWPLQQVSYITCIQVVGGF